jgi:uncharacterized membrane protein
LEPTKKSSHKNRIITLAVLAIVIAGIVVLYYIKTNSYQPTTSSNILTSSPYVEVNYTTVGWHYTYPLSDNEACLVLDLTITNEGYTDRVSVLAFTDFSLKISNVLYHPIIGVMIPNSSEPLGFSYVSPTLQSVTLMDGGSESGTIMFEFSKQVYNQPFALQCSMTTTKYATVSVKISGS